MNADDLCGTVLGTCTLQKVIGRGGMGAVYLAQQSRPRRQVAVKVLLPITTLQQHQQTAFLERFRRESDAAASLEHPNITPIHEYGEREGLAYLVMAYVSGGTLRDELETEGKLPLTRVVNYLEQIAAALDFAHERKVVHRDIKPANILMTPEKRLLLTDFGLVKIMIDGQNQNPLSEVGMPMGTPDYMAPEQVIGAEVDARADIYSLGVLLYHMVTGAPPFQGKTPMKVALQHVHMPPPLPRISRPDLPPAAEQVILRALTKRPADRYMTSRDLATAFRLALEAAGVQVGISGMGNEERGSGNRRRGLFDPVWRSSIPATSQVPAEIAHAEQKNAWNVKDNLPVINQAGTAQVSKGKMPRRDIIAQTSMTIPSFSGILTEENISNIRQANGLLYGSDMMPQVQQDNAFIGLAPDIQPKSPAPVATQQVHTPLPPIYEASPKERANVLSPQANPQSDQGIIAKPAHKLLFSPANLRPGHKTHLQNFQNKLPDKLNNRQTDKGPAFSAQSIHLERSLQRSEQEPSTAANNAGNAANKQNDPAVGRFAQLSPRGTLLHQSEDYDGSTKEAHEPLPTTVNRGLLAEKFNRELLAEKFNRELLVEKFKGIKTDIALILSQRAAAAIPTKAQLKAWRAQLQKEPWQDQIKNNKRKVLVIGLVFLIICVIVIYLISHAASTSSTTNVKQYGYQIGLSTITTTTRVVNTSATTLVHPSTYRAHSWVNMTDEVLKADIFSIGISGQMGDL
jgi:serine/threonine protein kinase